jgi:hypothetical protein
VLRARNIDPEMLLCKAAEPSRPGRIHERKPQKRHREAPLALKRSLLLLSGINKANQGAIDSPRANRQPYELQLSFHPPSSDESESAD